MRMLLASLSFLVLAAAGPTAEAAPNPLAALSGIQTVLGKGMSAVLKGQDGKAFGPLVANAKHPFGPELKAAGAVSARLLAVELELVFYSGDKPAYYLRSAVAPTRRGPAFVEIKGREVKDRLYVKPHPLSDFKGAAAPFATTAQALAKVLAAKDCSVRLPVAAPSEFDFLPPKIGLRAGRDLEKTRASLQEVCTHVAALKATRIEVRVDDVVYAALDKDGKMVGLIKAGFELVGGRLTVNYGKFRRNPPDR